MSKTPEIVWLPIRCQTEFRQMAKWQNAEWQHFTHRDSESKMRRRKKDCRFRSQRREVQDFFASNSQYINKSKNSQTVNKSRISKTLLKQPLARGWWKKIGAISIFQGRKTMLKICRLTLWTLFASDVGVMLLNVVERWGQDDGRRNGRTDTKRNGKRAENKMWFGV